ncbi:putative B3 domain-containing protein At3g49610 [Salvia miltiorrhiza]|uniref:putative B3 domain-containing protein At3g49610 n=1 Tax=Salvia miltiorrhiza TaxID=226208 RepID=UPI0025AC5AFC|nr:putative B3 domain-containing protein At3g49610 [Salvia miltiorrhiza]
MVFRNITIDDLKDKLDMKGSMFDVLVATAQRAKEILDKEEAEAAQTPPRPKRRRDERPAVPKISDKRRKPADNGPPVEQSPLPEEFKKAIEEMHMGSVVTPATLVIQKGLFGTDLSGGHNRLSIPISQIKDDFLTEEEKQHLRTYNESNKKKNFMEVKIVQPSLAPETVKFCRWDMPKKGGGKTSSSYVINGKWNSIVEKNKLKLGMVVQLWCFRVDQDLCFALVRLPRNNHA